MKTEKKTSMGEGESVIVNKAAEGFKELLVSDAQYYRQVERSKYLE